MDQVAVFVTQQLDFNVARLLDETFDEHVGVAEGRERLPPSILEGVWKLSPIAHHAHSPAAAALGRLENDGIPHLFSLPLALGHVGDRFLAAPEHRNAGIRGNFSGCDLVAEAFEHLHLGADEDDPLALTGTGEIRVLGQKTVAGMDGVHLILSGQRDDPLDVEVRPDRLVRLADQIRLVRLEAVKSVSVLV